VDARDTWRALQERLTTARSLFEAGETARALKEVDAALEVDPHYLAAHSLRDRILRGQPVASLPATAQPWPGPPVFAEGYAKFEERAKRRRVDRRAKALRAAAAQGRLKDALAALDEIRGLDPNLPDLRALEQLFDEARRSEFHNHHGARVAATAVFVATVFTWRLATEPQALTAYPLSTPAVPLPGLSIAESVFDVPEQPVATANFTAIPPVIDRKLPDRPTPTRVAEVETGPVPQPVLDTPREVAPPVVVASFESNVVPPAASPIERAVPAPVSPPTSLARPVPAPPTVDEEVLVQQALQRYRRAYDGLDARSAREVWPRVNEAALTRAFDSLESQKLIFDACTVQLRGEAATAMCRGSARYVPKVGSHEPRVEPRVWNFTLQKRGTAWTIETARAER